MINAFVIFSVEERHSYIGFISTMDWIVYIFLKIAQTRPTARNNELVAKKGGMEKEEKKYL